MGSCIWGKYHFNSNKKNISDNIIQKSTVEVVSNIIFLLSFSFLVPEKDKNIDLYPRIIFLLVLLWPTQRSKNSSGDPQNGCAQGL